MKGQDAYEIYKTALDGRKSPWYTAKQNSLKYKDETDDVKVDGWIRQTRAKSIDTFFYPEFNALPERERRGWNDFAEQIQSEPEAVAKAWEAYAQTVDLDYFSDRRIKDFDNLPENEQDALQAIAETLLEQKRPSGP